MSTDKVNSTYLHKLAQAYWRIDSHGLLVSEARLKILRHDLLSQRKIVLERLSNSWGIHVYVGVENKPGKSTTSLNLNTPNKLLEFLESRGFKLPKVRRKDKETMEVTYEDSVEELALRRAFALETDIEKLQNYTDILTVRELNTLNNRYLNARLHNWTYYSNYNVAGPVTGRRASRKTCFGLGGNSQNFPHHYEMGTRFLECLVARPGNIFFIVDQMQAEDWPVSALSENHKRMEMLSKTDWPDGDGHTQLASFIFGIPITSRNKKEWKNSIERYLGKKCRHAYNYGMREHMMSDSIAKEGRSIDPQRCRWMLDKVGQYDPSIDSVFHEYIRNQVFTNKKLTTPFGRERVFLGLRQNDNNYKILNEAYSYIPQSTVADNTGLSVLYLDTHGANITNESHDSITQEIPDEWEQLERTFTCTGESFNRKITFHNGIEIQIPIEAEIGFDLKNTIKLEHYTLQDLKTAYDKLKEQELQRTNAEEITQTLVT